MPAPLAEPSTSSALPQRWLDQTETLLATTRVFSVREVVRRAETSGREAKFAVLDCPDWVNVVALTVANDLILIEQFRHGTGSFTLEIAGGMVDPGETPAQAAARELLEETGYLCGELRQLGVVEPNPAIQGNRCWTFLATGCVAQHAPTFDPHDTTEECVVQLVPAATAGALVRSGRIGHALVVAAFAHAFLAGVLPVVPDHAT